MQSRRNGRRFSVPARLAELEDVDAGAERGALAAQHHAVDVVVVGGLARGLAQREHEIAVEGVALLGPVEDQMPDPPVGPRSLTNSLID